jgi:nicotinamide mononucleotide (NMN) deamidase PncC
MAKVKVLGVSEESLKDYGAVSEQVACEMAAGVRNLFDTTYGIVLQGFPGRAEVLRRNLLAWYIWL